MTKTFEQRAEQNLLEFAQEIGKSAPVKEIVFILSDSEGYQDTGTCEQMIERFEEFQANKCDFFPSEYEYTLYAEVDTLEKGFDSWSYQEEGFITIEEADNWKEEERFMLQKGQL